MALNYILPKNDFSQKENVSYEKQKEAYEKITSKNNSSDPWSNLAKSRILSMQIDGKVE